MQRYLCPVLFFLLAAQRVHAAVPGPADTVSAFYTWNIQHSHSTSDRRGVKRFISAELACLQKKHSQYLRAFGSAFPELKPALAEFDFYSGYISTPERFNVIASRTSGDKAEVHVRLFLDEEMGDRHGGMLNTVELQQYGGTWVITDVRYAYRMRTFKEARLRAVLYDDMSYEAPPMRWKASQLDQCRQMAGPATHS